MLAFIGGALAFHDALLTALSWTAGAAAAALFIPGARTWAARSLDAVDAFPELRMRRIVLLFGAAVAAYIGLLKSCQYFGFQFQSDTSYTPNTAANFLAGRGLASTIYGAPSILSIHFAFFVPVFLAPVLLVWRSTLALLFLQAAALASMGPAAYLLARRRCGTALALLLMALVLAHPSLHQLITCNLDDTVFLAPLLLWGMVLWESGHPRWALLPWLLALTTREQVPFTLASAGVCWALFADRPVRRRAAEGAGIVLSAGALWFAEMRVVAAHGSLYQAQFWARYSNLGQTSSDAITAIIARPWSVAPMFFWPPAHIAPLAFTVLCMGLLPLASPPAFAFFWLSAAHHLLQARYIFNLHDVSYTFAPLIFAAACGLARLASLPVLQGRRVWILVPALAAAGIGLHGAARIIHPTISRHLVAEAPPLLRQIPPGASVWTDEYLGARLAARPQLKLLWPLSLPDRFAVLLFRPEYVLVDKGVLPFLSPPDKSLLVGFLSREGYAKVGESRSLVLLKDPAAPRKGPSPDLLLPGAPDDQARVVPYLSALFDSPEARAKLAAYPPDLRLEPATAEGHVNLGRALAERRLYPLAAAHYRAALARMPDFAEAHNNLGNALMAQGDVSGAEEHLRAALGLKPDYPMVRYNLGNVLLRTGKPAEAAVLLEAALADTPRDARLLNSLGAARLLSGRREQARAAFAAALAADASLQEARDNLKALTAREARP